MIIQRGVGTYLPKHSEHVDFVEQPKLLEWLRECRVVVSHSGAGSILDALGAHKPLVLVPRSVCFGEHRDEHQFELAASMAERQRAVVVTDVSTDTLFGAISEAEQLGGGEADSRTNLYTALQVWLAQQDSGL